MQTRERGLNYHFKDNASIDRRSISKYAQLEEGGWCFCQKLNCINMTFMIANHISSVACRQVENGQYGFNMLRITAV